MLTCDITWIKRKSLKCSKPWLDYISILTQKNLDGIELDNSLQTVAHNSNAFVKSSYNNVFVFIIRTFCHFYLLSIFICVFSKLLYNGKNKKKALPF